MHSQSRKLATDEHGKISFNFPLGARTKVANGVVAVGLPHRNYSVLKQAHIINQSKVKSKRRGASTSGFTSAAQ
jgi:hypothetical protein